MIKVKRQQRKPSEDRLKSLRIQIDLNRELQRISYLSLLGQIRSKYGIVLTDIGQLTGAEAMKVLKGLRKYEFQREKQ